MRHRTATTKLGRKTEHRQLMLANQVCSLIIHNRITTTLAKARAVRPLAEKMVTLGKDGSLHARRSAMAVLRRKDATKRLFDEIAPRCAHRAGGYTRIVKLGPRHSDAAPMALIEWVDAFVASEPDETQAAGETGAGPAQVSTPSKRGSQAETGAASKGATTAKAKADKVSPPAKPKKTAATPRGKRTTEE